MELERIRWWRLLSLVCLAGALATACADTGEKEGTGTGTPTWTSLTSGSGALVSCQSAGCHLNPASSAPAGLSFETDQYTAVLAAPTPPECGGATPIVTPGNSANSVMYMVATGDGRCSDVTPLPMPQGATAAPDIAAWIDGGALQ